MKIVYITTASQYMPVNGRVFEAFCEYDPDLLEAHKIAQEMADIMGISLSEMRYCISDNAPKLGAIISYDVDNLSSARLEDRRLERVGADLLFADIDKPVEWHRFHEIDIDAYEELIFNGGDDIIKEPERDIF